MLSVNNLSLYFGGQDVFRNISFMINKGDKIGLTGKNGAGKSTLLKILSSNLSPNNGSVVSSNKLIIGYLTQDLDFEDGRTVLEEANTAFDDLNKIKFLMDQANTQLIERTDYESEEYMEIISNFNQLEESYRIRGGHETSSMIGNILTGLGFEQKDFDRKTNEFSGGWRMRIELAKLLLKKPDLLLLDEPTNHLDIESIVWLENWISNYTGAVVLVSHDKLFLDALTNRTIEIAFSKINDYKASYTKYLTLREDRIEKQIQAKKNQDKYIEETKLLINKFRAKKNKAAFAQTLIKKLDKLEIIEVEKEDIGSMNFRFPPAPHSGKITVTLKDINKDYDGMVVLKDINLEISKGDKIAFVGKNGEGKSTLAKIINNEVKYYGEVSLGHQVRLGYYAQNQSDYLDENLTVLQTIEEAANESNIGKSRSILGSFLFSNDDVSKKIKVLSGGERARVSLCKLLLEPYNFLIMDEPTNHLDITSKDLLKQALLNYSGSLIIVSHDREFLQGLTHKVYEFKNKNVKEYLGDINYFLQEKDFNSFKQLEMSLNQKDNITKSKSSKYLDQKTHKKEINRINNSIKKLESKIQRLQKKKSEVDQKLSDPITYEKLSTQEDFFKNYEKNQQIILDLETEWSNLVDKLNRLEKNSF